MSILISLSEETCIDCETVPEALEILRGLGVVAKRPAPSAPRIAKAPVADHVRKQDEAESPRAKHTANTGVGATLHAELAKGPATVQELAERFGKSRKSVSCMLDYLRRTGRAQRREDGRWEWAKGK